MNIMRATLLVYNQPTFLFLSVDPCNVDFGSCSQICYTSHDANGNKQKMCDCSYGFTLQRDGKTCNSGKIKLYLGDAKRKCVFEYAQNTQIQIHPMHAQGLIRAFALRWYML